MALLKKICSFKKTTLSLNKYLKKLVEFNFGRDYIIAVTDINKYICLPNFKGHYLFPFATQFSKYCGTRGAIVPLLPSFGAPESGLLI